MRCIMLFVMLFAFSINLGGTIESANASKYVHKCCPLEQYIGQKKVCKNFTPIKYFSQVPVYNKYVKEIGSSVEDTFRILPGKFVNNPVFKKDAIPWSRFGYTPYIVENGELLLEMPNVYDRWTTIPNGNFCIDYLITRSGVLSSSPHFWAIMEDESFPESDIYLTYATLVSCFFMLLVLVVYLFLPELRNLCGLILMAYVASLFMAFLLLATIQLSRYPVPVCIGLTLSIYYFFLASFCWISVMSYDIWWTFRGYAKARPIHRRGEHFKFLMYCLYAFGLPLVMTIAVGILNSTDMKHVPWFITPQVPNRGCFLEGGAKFVYLYIPMLILILSNWTFYLMTAFNLWRLHRRTAVLDSAAAGTPAAHRSHRSRFMVYLKLSVVMGLNWLFEIISFLYPGFKMWYISDAYNILIGFAIFLIFVWKKSIIRKLTKRFAVGNGRRFYTGSSKNTIYSNSNSDSISETSTLQVSQNPKGPNGYSGSIKNVRGF